MISCRVLKPARHRPSGRLISSHKHSWRSGASRATSGHRAAAWSTHRHSPGSSPWRAGAIATQEQGSPSMSLPPNYSLWLMPDKRVSQLVKQEIGKQSEAYSGPLFEPHVTLLPDIQGDVHNIKETSEALVGLLKKFRINFLDVTCGATFHKCVYILCANEGPLKEAGHLAREAFNMYDSPFMPHLSLLYADVPQEQRAQSAAAAVQRLYGEGADYSTLLPDNSCEIVAVSLWYTPVEDRSLQSWEKVAEWQLASD